MFAEGFKTAMKRLGWNDDEAARRLGQSKEEIAFWKSGRHKIPDEASRFIETMLSSL